MLRTLQGAQLRFCSPGYLAALKRGATLTMLGLLAWLIAHAAAVVIGLATGRLLDDPSPSIHPFFPLLTGAALLLALYGWWRLASPDPLIAAGERFLSGRRMLRSLVIGAGIATIADRVMLLTAGHMPGVSPAIWLAHLIAAMVYIRQLAARIPAAAPGRLAMVTLGVTPMMFIPCLPIMLITMTAGPWVITLLVLVTVGEFKAALRHRGA